MNGFLFSALHMYHHHRQANGICVILNLISLKLIASRECCLFTTVHVVLLLSFEIFLFCMAFFCIVVGGGGGGGVIAVVFLFLSLCFHVIFVIHFLSIRCLCALSIRHIESLTLIKQWTMEWGMMGACACMRHTHTHTT